MTFDSTVPLKLADLQRWFAGIITQKMAKQRAISLYAPSGNLLAIEAGDYIHETDNLSAKSRMQIYNQSYWLRLLAALHEEYPLVTRLFGTASFDETIGIPYLSTYPPTHWSLNLLGRDLVCWLKDYYVETDKDLIQTSAQIDWASQQSFFAQTKAFDILQYQGAAAEKLLYEPVKLQPHVHLIQAYGHFMHYRHAFLQEEPPYWEEHDFPHLLKEKTYHFIIFRNGMLNVEWDELKAEEYQMLKLIQEGSSIQQACDILQEMTHVNVDLVEEEVAFWVQKWLINQWLYT